MRIKPLQKGFCWIGVEFAYKQIHPPSVRRLIPMTIFRMRTNFASQLCRMLSEFDLLGPEIDVICSFNIYLVVCRANYEFLTLKVLRCYNHPAVTQRVARRLMTSCDAMFFDVLWNCCWHVDGLEKKSVKSLLLWNIKEMFFMWFWWFN